MSGSAHLQHLSGGSAQLAQSTGSKSVGNPDTICGQVDATDCALGNLEQRVVALAARLEFVSRPRAPSPAGIAGSSNGLNAVENKSALAQQISAHRRRIDVLTCGIDAILDELNL